MLLFISFWVNANFFFIRDVRLTRQYLKENKNIYRVISYSTTVIGKCFQNIAGKLVIVIDLQWIPPGTADWKETLGIYLISFVSGVDFVTWVAKTALVAKLLTAIFFFPPFVMRRVSILLLTSFVSCLMSDRHYFSLGSYPGKVFRRLNRWNFETFWKQLIFRLKWLLNVTERK